MTFELLVASLNQNMEELPEKMNIESDALIVNQCDCDKTEESTFKDFRIKVIFQSQRGVGNSRNTALLNATADICLFSDEDIVYDPGYVRKVFKAFETHPDASLIAFNVRVDERRRTYFNEDNHRIGWNNYGRYPAYALAVRRTDILKNGIRFSPLFGGGAQYSNGEDSLFLHDCLKKGLRIYSDTSILGEETYRESTWFHGFTDKFFFDRGVLFHFLYGKAASLMGIRFIMKNRGNLPEGRDLKSTYALLCEGIKEGKKL